MSPPVPRAAAGEDARPALGRGSTATSPPSSAARSLHRLEPGPGDGAPPGTPRPSSVTSIVELAVGREARPAESARPRGGRRWSSPRPRSGTRPPRRPPAARAGGRRDHDPGSRTRRIAVVLDAIEPCAPAGRSRRPARARRAPAGAGRRPAAGRRRAPRAPRRSAPRAGAWPPPDPSSSIAAEASARIPIAASVGPSPSCRSRRSRRRSSSRASTSRSRDRTRSSRSRIAPDRGARLAAQVLRAAPARPSRKPRSPAAHARARAARPAPRRRRAGRRLTTADWRAGEAAASASPPVSSIDLERHVRQAERVGDGLDDRRERAVGLRRPLEPLPEAPHRAPRLVAGAVHEPVDGPLEDVPQRQRDAAPTSPVASRVPAIARLVARPSTSRAYTAPT